MEAVRGMRCLKGKREERGERREERRGRGGRRAEMGVPAATVQGIQGEFRIGVRNRHGWPLNPEDSTEYMPTRDGSTGRSTLYVCMYVCMYCMYVCMYHLYILLRRGGISAARCPGERWSSSVNYYSGPVAMPHTAWRVVALL